MHEIIDAILGTLGCLFFVGVATWGLVSVAAAAALIIERMAY